jgi:sarcosine oxidase
VERYDAIVVGLGGAGSSAACHLAQDGFHVLGLEQFAPGHSLGSSHGRTRIYRTAYKEGPEYVPLMHRALALWEALQTRTELRIFQPTGALSIGPREAFVVDRALRTAESLDLPHSLLSATELSARFPQFVPREDEVAVLDPQAGVLFPENCVEGHLAQATEHGAQLQFEEPVRHWSSSDGEVRVTTASGEYLARSLVLTAGAWTRTMVPDLALPLEIERQTVHWFPASEDRLVRPDRMPVFLWDRPGEIDAYGIPDFGDGVKVGVGHGTLAAHPREVDRTIRESDVLPASAFVRRFLRGVEPKARESIACLYTNAPDHAFLIGHHPTHRNVIVVSACSGHGFKFTSVVGEIAASLAHDRPPGFELTPFDPGRFSRVVG